MKLVLGNKYKMKDLGAVQQYLGMEFDRTTSGGLFLHLTTYTEALVSKYNMQQCKREFTPLPLIWASFCVLTLELLCLTPLPTVVRPANLSFSLTQDPTYLMQLESSAGSCNTLSRPTGMQSLTFSGTSVLPLTLAFCILDLCLPRSQGLPMPTT